MADSYSFKVNGIDIQTDHETLPAKTILALAKEKGAIPGNPSEYILKGDKGTYTSDDIVNLREDNVFIAIPNKATPVA